MANKNEIPLKTIITGALTIAAKDISPSLNKDVSSVEECAKFLDFLATTHGITASQAFVAFTLLALKGACNSSSPASMSVDLLVEDGKTIQITKFDLEYACQYATKHTFLRRLAQAMAKDISYYAERNCLIGDLAKRLNNAAVAKGEAPLTIKERAWANSFCQELPDLENMTGPRIPTLLAEDYQKRFKNSSPKRTTKGTASESYNPREWRMGKPKSIPTTKTDKPTDVGKPRQK